MLLPLYKGRHGAATGGRRQRALRPGEAPPGTARLRWAALRRTAPHRTTPRRSPAGCADPAALPHGRPRSPGPSPAGPQYGSCPRPRHVPQGQRHEPPAHPPHPATQRLPPGSPQAPRRSSSSARPAGQRGGAILPAEGLFRGAGGRGNSVDIGHVRGGAAPIAAAELDPTARGSGAPRGAAGGRIFSGGRGWRRGRPASTGP